MKKVIATEAAPSAIGTYSQAVQAGDMLFISGQIPLVPETMTLVEGDFKERVRQCFRNLQAIAQAAGSDLHAAVKLQVFLTDMADFADVNAVMNEFIAEPYPARAAVAVKQLPKDVDIEIDAVLYLG